MPTSSERLIGRAKPSPEFVRTVLVRTATAIKDTVAECPDGAPGGVIYAALMSFGCSLEQFEQIMLGLIDCGWVTKRGDLYFPGPNHGAG